MGYQATAVAPVLVDVQAFDRKVDRRALDALTAAEAGERVAVRRARRSEQGAARRAARVRALSPLLRPARDAVARRRVVVAALLACAGRDRRCVGLAGCREDAGLGRPTRCWPRTTGRPTCSSASRTTKGSACRSSRRCTTGCRSSRSPSSAVPETLGAAGLCLPDKAPAAVAEAVSVVLTDPALRAQLAAPRRLAFATSTSCARARSSRRRSRSVVGVAA